MCVTAEVLWNRHRVRRNSAYILYASGRNLLEPCIRIHCRSEAVIAEATVQCPAIAAGRSVTVYQESFTYSQESGCVHGGRPQRAGVSLDGVRVLGDHWRETERRGRGLIGWPDGFGTHRHAPAPLTGPQGPGLRPLPFPPDQEACTQDTP